MRISLCLEPRGSYPFSSHDTTQLEPFDDEARDEEGRARVTAGHPAVSVSEEFDLVRVDAEPNLKVIMQPKSCWPVMAGAVSRA